MGTSKLSSWLLYLSVLRLQYLLMTRLYPEQNPATKNNSRFSKEIGQQYDSKMMKSYPAIKTMQAYNVKRQHVQLVNCFDTMLRSIKPCVFFCFVILLSSKHLIIQTYFPLKVQQKKSYQILLNHWCTCCGYLGTCSVK